MKFPQQCDCIPTVFILLIISGLLDSLTSTSESKDCPGVCVHTLATIICYEVLEDIQCPQANQKCCVESNNANVTGASPTQIQSTSLRPTTTTTTTTPKPMSKPTQNKNNEKTPSKSPSNASGKGKVKRFISFFA